MKPAVCNAVRAALARTAVLVPLLLAGAAHAQDEETPGSAPTTTTAPSAGTTTTTEPAADPGAPPPPPPSDLDEGEEVITPSESRQKPPDISEAAEIDLDFAADTTIYDLVKFFADLKRKNFILSDPKELQGKKITIISHHAVSPDAAYEAFLSALQVSGYTTTESAGTTKIVKASDASKAPIPVVAGGRVSATDGFVTHLIQLENVTVADVSKVVATLVPPEAEVTAYAPTNTLIITDTAHNLRKVAAILKELDVAAPKSSMQIYPLKFAEAQEVKTIIEQLFGTASTETSSDSRSSRSSRSSRTSSSSRRPSRSSRDSQADTEALTAGSQAKFISKVLDDERTNSLIVLANDEGHKAVKDLVGELDVDVDPQNRAKINVVYLEHAKAEEVAQVLQELSQETGNRRRQQAQTRTPGGTTTSSRTGTTTSRAAAEAAADGESRGAIAAFDSGMRIAADENTNSLVIIANQEDYQVVKSVIDKLDIERKQVFVDAIILELSSDDSFELGLAAHLPAQPSEEAVGFVGAQLGTQSTSITQDLLSGLAVGVFGENIDIPVTDPTTGATTSLAIPAFGIVLNALKTNSAVNIVSNPNVLTLDNQEAKIVVGRKIPFPQSSGLNNLGQPILTFQREDVAITLQVTPRINSSNYVTLEIQAEVAEIEEDDQGLNVQQSGFITSKRELETVALVRDNQTMVLGGLVGTTDTEVETKLPVLGDVPLIGALFRGSRRTSRKTNLMIFLTPHIIDDEDDMYEIQRVKEAQRQEFLRRFYGKSREKYVQEMRSLLRYSMNFVDQPSMFRGPVAVSQDLLLDGEPLSPATRAALEAEMETSRRNEPGAGAGELPEEPGTIEIGGVDETLPEGPQPDTEPVAPPPEEP